MRARRFRSIAKHSGALMSSRLIPPKKVGSSAATAEPVRVLGIYLYVEHVDAGEFLEQDRLALHHRLAGESADIAKSKNSGAVGDHADKVAAGGVIARGVRIGFDLLAGGGDPGRIGQRQIALCGHAFGGLDRQFAGPRIAVIIERGAAEVFVHLGVSRCFRAPQWSRGLALATDWAGTKMARPEARHVRSIGRQSVIRGSLLHLESRPPVE